MPRKPRRCWSFTFDARRVGITAAASELQSKGLIEYRRGDLKVLDRAGLKAAACSCYAIDCKVYAELLS